MEEAKLCFISATSSVLINKNANYTDSSAHNVQNVTEKFRLYKWWCQICTIRKRPQTAALDLEVIGILQVSLRCQVTWTMSTGLAWGGRTSQQKKRGIQRKDRMAAPAATPASRPRATLSTTPSNGSLWTTTWWVPWFKKKSRTECGSSIYSNQQTSGTLMTKVRNFTLIFSPSPSCSRFVYFSI